MGEVVDLGAVTSLDMPAERVLEGALAQNLESAVIIGCRDDGSFFFASSVADGGSVLWLMEIARKRLMQMADSLMQIADSKEPTDAA